MDFSDAQSTCCTLVNCKGYIHCTHIVLNKKRTMQSNEIQPNNLAPMHDDYIETLLKIQYS